jgi:hypothetical protein
MLNSTQILGRVSKCSNCNYKDCRSNCPCTAHLQRKPRSELLNHSACQSWTVLLDCLAGRVETAPTILNFAPWPAMQIVRAQRLDTYRNGCQYPRRCDFLHAQKIELIAARGATLQCDLISGRVRRFADIGPRRWRHPRIAVGLRNVDVVLNARRLIDVIKTNQYGAREATTIICDVDCLAVIASTERCGAISICYQLHIVAGCADGDPRS